MRSDKGSPTVVCIVLRLLYSFINISENFSQFSGKKNYKARCNLVENYKSRQNTANQNISRISGSAGFTDFFLQNSAGQDNYTKLSSLVKMQTPCQCLSTSHTQPEPPDLCIHAYRGPAMDYRE